VYLAIEQRSERLVVVKVLSDENDEEDYLNEVKFLNEVAAPHPNIVQCVAYFAVSDFDGSLQDPHKKLKFTACVTPGKEKTFAGPHRCIVMEHCSGGTLTDFIADCKKAAKPLPLLDLLDLALQLCW
jgi:serine/threonine protein kinase